MRSKSIESGAGILESVYRRCLAYELRAEGLSYEAEKVLAVRCKDLILDGDLRLDLLVEGALVVELKAVESLLPLHEAQLPTYMRVASVRTGLLINFNSRSIKEGPRRLVL